MSKSLLLECQRAADELGALLSPPATLKICLEPVLLRSNKAEGPSIVARACVTAPVGAHARTVQAETEGLDEREALTFLKAALALKLRFVQSASSGTRRGPPPMSRGRAALGDA